MKEKFLVTPALPYANGAPHLGHLVENIQANVFVRALRMADEDVLYVCGADAHGTPIELNAKKAGISPSEFATKWQKAFESSFKQFHIEFDSEFGTTDTELNKSHAETLFEIFKDKGHIKTNEIEQLYDPKSKRFLPDRLVLGTCPKCKAENQYGDSCESCGGTYRPTELIEPRSALSNETPVLKKSKHYFFELESFSKQLQKWAKQPGAVHEDVQSYLARWFKEGLKDWDISRDGPYFGFLIPGEKDKYFYVWLDAPVGYISLTQAAAEKKGRTVWDYWKDKNTRIVHFIGKDIIYFHTLFWPAMLMAADYTLPETVAVHGMLTVNGEKMSKSRGTFILADDFAKYLDPQTLRYYLSCKLSPRIEDIDLSLEDFISRVNTDLVNKVVNLISRTVPMIHRSHQGVPGSLDKKASGMLKEVEDRASKVENLYRNRDTAHATKEIVSIADLANRYLQDAAPWDKNKNTPEQALAQLSTALWVGKVCIALLKPILPIVAEKTEAMLNMDPFTFDNLFDNLKTDVPLQPFTRLFERIDPKQVKKMTEHSKQEETKTNAAQPSSEDASINIQDFMKIDLRAAKVLESKAVEGADRLISLTLDVGELGKRHVFTGLRPKVEPEELQDKTLVLVANLAPRKMKFGVSEGMVLASEGSDGQNLAPVILDKANPGDKIR